MRLHMHVEVAGRRVVVIGAGRAGAEKVVRLAEAGAEVVVIDPSPVAPEVAAAAADVVQRPFRVEDVEGAWLVIAATGDEATDEAVAAAAAATGVWTNRADQADGGDVTFGAVVRRGRVEIGVTTGGASPTLSRWVRDRVDAAVPDQVGLLAELLAERPRVDGRRAHRAVDIDAALGALTAGDEAGARRLVIGD